MHIPRSLASLAVVATGLAGQPRDASCQDRTDSMMVARVTPSWTIGSVSFQVGAAHLGLSELNETLSANGRPAFSTDVPTIGISAYARFGRLLIGGSGESALPRRETSPGWTNRISFRSATLDAGVALVDRPRFLLRSEVSLGLRITSLRMERSGDFPYEDGVRDPARGVAMSSLGAMAGVGMVAELRVATRATGEFSIGLRAGVAGPVGNAATSAGESSVTGTPRESAGRYLRLTLAKPIGRRRDVMSALSTALLSIVAR